MSIRYRQDDNGYLVYKNTKTGQVVHIWDGDLADAVEICEQWHGGQGSPCYRLMSADYSLRTLRSVAAELRHAQHLADRSGIEVDGDDYLDLLTSIEDLDGILARIDKIAD